MIDGYSMIGKVSLNQDNKLIGDDILELIQGKEARQRPPIHGHRGLNHESNGSVKKQLVVFDWRKWLVLQYRDTDPHPG